LDQVSLDVFVARPDGDRVWANVDDELHTFANEQARSGHVPERPADV